MAAHRLERFEPKAPHQLWSMDFVADNLFDGRRFRGFSTLLIDTLVENEKAFE